MLGFVFLFVLVVMPMVLGVEVELSRDSYYPQETLQAEITGSFISLKVENIQVYKDGVPRANPVISDLVKKDDVYYFYAVLPFGDGNYSLVIEGARYYEWGEIVEEDVRVEFMIDKNRSDDVLGVNPGFVISDKEFSINVKSLNKNMEIDLGLEGGEGRTLSLVRGISKDVKFSVEGINGSIVLNIGDYTVPVFVTSSEGGFIVEKTDLVIFPSKLEGDVVAGESYIFDLIVENSGDKEIGLVSFEGDGIIVRPNFLNLSVGESLTINVSVSIPKKTKDVFESKVVVKYGSEEKEILILFNISEKVDLQGTSVSEGSSCSQQGGKLCLDEESCDGSFSPSLDGACCKGECVIKKKSNWGTIIGIILVVVVLGVIGFLIWKSRKGKTRESPEDYIRDKVGGKKDSGEVKSKEVVGKVDRVGSGV